jgi:chromosomal replication initiation ATPase DnaA
MSTRLDPVIVEGWNRAYEQLKLQADNRSWETWLNQLQLHGFCDGTLILSVRSQSALDICRYRWSRGLQRLVADVFSERPENVRIEIIRREL